MARTLPTPPSSSDDGAPDPAVAAALTAYTTDLSRRPQAVAAVQASRLLVPVVALLGEVEYDDQGRPRDKSSDMASVLLTSGDGRLGLLAFTGLPAMAAWDPEARPVPVSAQRAAQAAVQQGAAALLVDLAGPVRLVIEGADLEGLVRGWSLVRIGDDHAWLHPADSAGRADIG